MRLCCVWRCCCAGRWRTGAGQRKQVNLRVSAPFVAHDSAETHPAGCVWFVEETGQPAGTGARFCGDPPDWMCLIVEETPKQRLKHSYPLEDGEVCLFREVQ